MSPRMLRVGATPRETNEGGGVTCHACNHRKGCCSICLALQQERLRQQWVGANCEPQLVYECVFSRTAVLNVVHWLQ